jgi:hypothetical protein
MFFTKILITFYRNFNSAQWASQDIFTLALQGNTLMRQGDTVKVRENRGLMARSEAGKAWQAGKINRGM